MKNFASASGLRPRLAITLAITTLITGLLATACQDATNTNQGSQDQNNSTPSTTNAKGLKIGSLLPATGDLAPIGQAMLASVPLAVEQANQCGGVRFLGEGCAVCASRSRDRGAPLPQDTEIERIGA